MEEKEILNEIEFCLSGEYITLEHEQAIQKLVELYKHEKEIAHFVQNKLDEANAKIIEQEKMIDEMAKYISGYDIDEDVCRKMGKVDKYGDCEENCTECVKEHFKKKASEEKWK